MKPIAAALALLALTGCRMTGGVRGSYVAKDPRSAFGESKLELDGDATFKLTGYVTSQGTYTVNGNDVTLTLGPNTDPESLAKTTMKLTLENGGYTLSSLGSSEPKLKFERG